MTVKSILDIEINDDTFKEFHKLFQNYQEELKKMPAAWADVAKGTQRAAHSFGEHAAFASAFAKSMIDIEKAQKRSNDAATSAGRIWHTMARDTRTVAVNIADTTRQLLRWAEITGVVSGLLGAGGLFGISRLAQSAAAGRQTASGLDVSYGQNRAFSINYGRFLDNPGSTLGNVSNALHDATSPGYRALLGAGISPQFLQSHNAAEVSAELLHRLPGRIPHATAQDRALEGSRLKSYGLDAIISQQELNRLFSASPEERATQDKSFVRGSRDFDQSGKTQRGWQDFTTQLDRAGTKIEEIFIRGLAPLAKPLSDLSDSMAKAVGSLLGSDKLKGWITDLGHGIEHVATYLLSPGFDKDLKDFVTGIEQVVKALGSAYHWITGLFAPGEGPHSRGFFVGHAGKSGVIDLHNRDRHRGRHGYLGTRKGTVVPGAGTPDIPPNWDPHNSNSYWNGDQGAIVPDGWGPDLHHMAYMPGEGGSSGRGGMDQFGRSFMMMVLAAEAVTARFKDLSDAVGGLLGGTGSAGAVGAPGALGGAGGSLQNTSLGSSRGGRGSGTGISLGAAGPVAPATQNQLGRIKTAVSYFMGQGLSKEAAIGWVAGTIGGESAYGDPRHQRGDGGTAFGIGQWHMDRVQDILAHTGIDVRTAGFEDQLKAMRWDAQYGKGGGHVWSKLKAAKTADEAVHLGVYGFERPRNKAGDTATRSGMARGIGRQLEGFAGAAHEASNRPEMHRGRGLSSYHGVTKHPRIEIQNNTGGNAIISAHMLTIGT